VETKGLPSSYLKVVSAPTEAAHPPKLGASSRGLAPSHAPISSSLSQNFYIKTHSLLLNCVYFRVLGIQLLIAIDYVQINARNSHSRNDKSSNEVARTFDIPPSTLRSRLAKGLSKRGGFNKKLTNIRENVICKWLDRSISHGFPIDKIIYTKLLASY
jgi:hypothetical protein